VFLIAPFSALYYPVAILPLWMQKVAAFIPTSYLFEGARGVILTGQINWQGVWLALGLNILYLIISLFLFNKSFKHILTKGLVKFY
jgi:ABC-2 type transport system permease protein